MSPTDIEAFLRVAETRSFSQAGRELGLSQPAVSARISHLEQVMGVPLLNRTTRRVTMTASGERLRVRISRVMAELQGLQAELHDEAALRRGRVVVGASPSVASGFLAAALSLFVAQYPNIEVVLHDDFYGHALDRVGRGEVDLAVIPFEPAETAFDFELLFTDRFVLAVPTAHPLAERREVTLTDFAGEKLVSMPPEAAAWTTVKRAFEQAGLPFQPAMQTRNALTIVALVRAGFGVALVTEMLTGLFPGSSGLVLLHVRGADLVRRIGIVAAKGQASTPAAEAFKRTLRLAARGVEMRADQGDTGEPDDRQRRR